MNSLNPFISCLSLKISLKKVTQTIFLINIKQAAKQYFMCSYVMKKKNQKLKDILDNLYGHMYLILIDIYYLLNVYICIKLHH